MAYGRLTHTRGDTFSHKIILPNEDEDANTIDWSTADFLSQIRVSELATDVLAECVVDYFEDDPSYVILYVPSLTADMVADTGVGTTDWPAGSTLYMDFQETRDGSVRTPAKWKIKLNPDISHD